MPALPFLGRVTELAKTPDTFHLLNLDRRIPPDAYASPKQPLLWDYHFHYFDGLLAEAPEAAAKFRWVEHWLANVPVGARPAWDPYPTSRRIFNWVKWARTTDTTPSGFDSSLTTQVSWLERALEYHLLGNHLLTNAIALVAAGVHFSGQQGDAWLQRGVRLLERELAEQFLPDGAHFELSPTYHALVLSDIMELHALLASARLSGPAQLPEVIGRAMGWLQAVTRPDGRVPLFNDATYGVAPSTGELVHYAARLGLDPHGPRSSGPLLHLESSGHFTYRSDRLCVVADVGEIGPSYQPGHGHCDQLSFELCWDGDPIIVDTGVSTYEEGARRLLERGTAAHNTVQVGDREQSEIWKSFRVARRGRVEEVVVEENAVQCRIRAFPPRWVRLERRWELDGERMVFHDQALSDVDEPLRSRLHFHPDVRLEGEGAKWRANGLYFEFHGDTHVNVVPFEYAPGFNRRIEARCLEVEFSRRLTTVVCP